ncbi:MAG TPA: heparan-alpha-glucosaminide N-acetyltransferase domain-containing protein, partial [Myxococcales bacterium]|nr:heparan-alpha-glucosaminide N-acetyltransferase domain-containing protein [Myxococcales bacterium]
MSAAAGPAPGAQRVLAVDWLRGAVVLLMIQCHAMILLLPELRKTSAYGVLSRIDGLVAPSFILAAGFSMGLVLVRAAQQGKLKDRVGKTSKRLLEVFAVAYAYTWFFLGGRWHPESWLRVDILHCIAFSLLICLVLAANLAPRPLALSLVAPALGGLVFALSPFAEGVRGFWSHVANGSSDSMFPLFPWLGYALLGLALGSETARGGVQGLLRACLWLMAVGLVLTAFRPAIVAAYPPHNEWVTSPAEHGVRLAKVMGITLVLMALERAVRAPEKKAPFRVLGYFGTNSLGGYFFHLAFLYVGLFGVSFAAFWRDSCG